VAPPPLPPPLPQTRRTPAPQRLRPVPTPQWPPPVLLHVRLHALAIESPMNLKKYIFAGLLVWLPLAITLWVLSWLIGVLDGIFANVLQGLGNFLPQGFNDSFAHLRDIRGLGVILVFLVLLVLISGTKLYLDHLNSTKQTSEISALTVENDILSTRLDSVEKQLKIRIQELEKLGANVTELRFLQDQLIQEKNHSCHFWVDSRQ
jgi:hypothetical protein